MSNYEEIIQTVRARSAPVRTLPVGWSEKTELLMEILRKNNPYQDTRTLHPRIQRDLKLVKQLPEPRNYLPWFAIGPGFKEASSKLDDQLKPRNQNIYKDYCEY